MKRTLVVVAAVVGFATAASAATLTVASDQGVYNVGDTITLTVTGNSAGATAYSMIGRLDYSAALTQTNQGATQTVQTGWTLGAVSPFGDGSTTMFNQIAFPAAGFTGPATLSVQTLIAQAVGVVSVVWGTGSGQDLSFFDVNNANAPNPAVTFTIVPEPTTVGLLGLGLLGLAFGGRRRA